MFWVQILRGKKNHICEKNFIQTINSKKKFFSSWSKKSESLMLIRPIWIGAFKSFISKTEKKVLKAATNRYKVSSWKIIFTLVSYHFEKYFRILRFRRKFLEKRPNKLSSNIKFGSMKFGNGFFERNWKQFMKKNESL